MLDKIASRQVGQFSVRAPPGYIGRRDQTDSIALLEAGYGCPNGLDDTRSLVPEPTRKLSFLKKSVCAEHDFRTIEADALHLDLHFVGSRWGDIQVFNLQNTWITVLMESNDTCHGRLQPFRSKGRGCYALGEKVCCFSAHTPKSAFVKGLTFNSGSSPLHIQWRGLKIKRDLLATPF